MNKTLSTKLWSDENLRPEIQKKLIEISSHFYTFLNTELKIHDIQLVGSMAAYNYGSKSDIDVHILLDFNENGSSNYDLIYDLLMTKKDLYNLKRNITVKGQKVELYPQDINQPLRSAGVYSLLFQKWVKKPTSPKTQIDTTGVLKISRIYQELIDDIVKLEDDKLKLDLAKKVKGNMVQRRNAGLEADGESSKENLLYKKLRNSGFQKLFDAINQTTDKQLSLEQKEITSQLSLTKSKLDDS